MLFAYRLNLPHTHTHTYSVSLGKTCPTLKMHDSILASFRILPRQVKVLTFVCT